mmetsp:Transcript_3517/g.8092  ORF Transcript_3517/g.8092 Transcript_3517/m.8092 type:complete len:430 (-) Transcript_3517:76-1365(-)
MGYLSEFREAGSKSKRNTFLVLGFLFGTIIFWGILYQFGFPRGRNRVSLDPVGCVPYARFSCPAMMECGFDPEFAYYGRCVCDPTKAMLAKPPVFDDREVDDPFVQGGSYCYPDWANALINTLGALPVLFSLFVFHKVATSTMWKLISQNDKFKWNSTTRGLVILYLAHFCGAFFTIALNLLVMYGTDKQSILFDYFVYASYQILNFGYNLGSYELTISWFDLVQRTVKMSRTSARWMTAIKWFMRVFNIVWNGILANVLKFPEDQYVNYLMGQLAFHAIVNLIPGLILSRMLCKNSKDVTNPNWKAAQVIRRTYTINFQSQCLGILSFYFQGKAFYPLFFQTGYWWWFAYLTLCLACVMQAWGWLHYILFGSRKLLASGESDRISQYFGFTTIGLNSTLVSGISRVSSVASSVASMASSASVVEKEDD